MRKIDLIIQELNKYQTLNIKFKEDSLLMKIIGFLLFFNKRFNDSFVTTINDTIYISRKTYDKLPDEILIPVIFHEYIHIKQSKKYTLILYSFLYLFPQILFLVGFFGFFNYYLFLFFLFALPIPAPFRKTFEVDAYKVTLFTQKYLGYNSNLDHLNSIFTGPYYYFMWPFGVKDNLMQEYSGEELEIIKQIMQKYFEI